MLADYLGKQGHRVTWWTSTFNHTEKLHRFKSDTIVDINPNVRLNLLHSVAYRSNISLARISNHRGIARRFADSAILAQKPDIIVCSLPTLEFCSAATAFGKTKSIPVLLDVRDLWPDIFLDLVPAWLQRPWRVALTPLFISAGKSCRDATGIIGPTNDFVKWGLNLAKRVEGPNDRVFPFAYPQDPPDQDSIHGAESFWASKGIVRDPKKFRICFFGAISRQFELDIVIGAAKKLQFKGDFEFVLCGRGDRLEEYQAQASSSGNIIFPGYVNASQIWTLMRISQIGLAPYRNTRNFSGHVPNKVVEYFSAGLPVVSSLTGSFREILSLHKCGLHYDGTSSEALAASLISIHGNPGLHKQMSIHALQLYESTFTSEKVLGEMARHLEGVIQRTRGSLGADQIS